MEKERRKHIRKEQRKAGPEEEIFDFFVTFSSLLLLLFCNLLNILIYEHRALRKKIVDRDVGFIDVPE